MEHFRKQPLFLGEDLTISEIETQLTPNEESFVCAGCVSWLYEEEFETEKGYVGSLDSKKMWFLQVDQRQVPKRTVDLSEPGTTETNFEVG